MKISEKIKRIMNIKGLNYRSLGNRVGYSDVQVRNIIIKEQTPKIDFIQSIIREFSDINPMWFFDDSEEMTLNNIVNEPDLLYGKKVESELENLKNIIKLKEIIT